MVVEAECNSHIGEIVSGHVGGWLFAVCEGIRLLWMGIRIFGIVLWTCEYGRD